MGKGLHIGDEYDDFGDPHGVAERKRLRSEMLPWLFGPGDRALDGVESKARRDTIHS